jgi:hypothetical protein
VVIVRKRLVIGAIAAVVIGVAAYTLLPPKRGSVEYHKKKYLEAHDMGVVGKWINGGPAGLQDLYWLPKYKRIDFHRNALLEGGYFARRVFVVSNRAAEDLFTDLHKIRFEVFTDTNDIAGTPLFSRVGTNRIEVLARAIDMDKWDDVIRKLDVPETK